MKQNREEKDVVVVGNGNKLMRKPKLKTAFRQGSISSRFVGSAREQQLEVSSEHGLKLLITHHFSSSSYRLSFSNWLRVSERFKAPSSLAARLPAAPDVMSKDQTRQLTHKKHNNTQRRACNSAEKSRFSTKKHQRSATENEKRSREQWKEREQFWTHADNQSDLIWLRCRM